MLLLGGRALFLYFSGGLRSTSLSLTLSLTLCFYDKMIYPGHSLPVGGVPVRRPLIGFTGVPVTLPWYMRSSCPRGRLGATRARCAQASAPQARMASRRRNPPAYRIICARSARVYAEYHALYAKAPHCYRRYIHSLINGTKTFDQTVP